jgi:hypothetical protein
VVVTEGLAMTLSPEVARNPVAGDQKYGVVPLAALKVTDDPAQIARLVPLAAPLMVSTGAAVTVT